MTTSSEVEKSEQPSGRRFKRRKLYIDMAGCLTIIWPYKADENKAHCPRTHHALGMVYIPPRGGWIWVTFGQNPLQGIADTEKNAIRAIRKCWGLY